MCLGAWQGEVLKEVRLRGWCAWSPGIESEGAWRDWLCAPRLEPQRGAPEVRFVPTMLRRRCDDLARMMLHLAEVCCGGLRSEVTSVFASRQGSICTTVELLERLAVDAPISQALFIHSVHNTQGGIFSIWAGNQHASSSMAAGIETFPHAFLEAVGVLHRNPGRPVFLAVGDESYPEPIASMADHFHGGYAVGLLLAADGEGVSLRFGLDAVNSAASSAAGPLLPDAIAFVRWWLSQEPSLRIVHGPRTWTWMR